MLNFKHTLLLFFLIPSFVCAQEANKSPDSLAVKSKYPFFLRWNDTYLSRFNYSLTPVLSLKPDSLKTKVTYDYSNKNFTTTEDLSSKINLKKPQVLSFNEYSSLQNAALRKAIVRDFEKAQDGNSEFGGKRSNPLLAKTPILDRLFGDKVPEFQPNGFISVDFKAGTQFINNPLTPLALRRQPVFDFDQQIAVNFNNLFKGLGSGSDEGGVNPNEEQTDAPRSPQLSDIKNVMRRAGQAREKMNILGNFDTKSAFQFENKFKINFKNEPEDILQKVELGNVSMPNRSQLIPGVQNLLGAKIGLKFGKLDITAVGAQQNSRTESILINGGNANQGFEIRCDNYEENKHFFLGHFFRDNYEKSLKNLPMVTSGVRITRLEVYVTNRSNNVSSMRNLVGLADLGETKPFKSNLISTKVSSPSSESNPYDKNLDRPVNKVITASDNLANDLYGRIASDENFRRIDNATNVLTGLQFTNGEDFEILRGAKRLVDREFEYNAELGYISLLTPLRNDEVLGVSYEYTYQGRAYKVGELTEDYVNKKEDEVIILKLLKSSTIRNRLSNPMWDLMMKNVYTLAQGQIKKEGFQLRIVYKDDISGLDSPNLKEGINLAGKPIIEAFGLDRLNFNNDPLKDGNFDYVEGVTIQERYGRVIFPVLEPFGSHLATKFTPSEASLKEKYVFNELYDKTLTDAQQISLKNKFFISGSVQIGSTEIALPLGASASSVRVYSGANELKSGQDYTVDTQSGRLILTNPSILSSGRQIRVEFEKPDVFQSQIRRLFGLRLDYTLSRNIRLGATVMDLKETTPGFVTRTSIGNEPVANTQWGLDLNMKKDFPGLTRMLDGLPGLQTKELSSIILSAEIAQLRPGVNNKKVNGSSMIDDFEYARNSNDLAKQPTKWRLGSTPQNLIQGISGLNQNPYLYNNNRAKLSVYSADPSVYINQGFGASNVVPSEIQAQANNNIYERAYQIQDIFPGRSRLLFAQQLPTTILDLAFFPEEPGMYNYNSNLNANGLLTEPKKSFGSTVRGITFDADFDNSNVEFQEFWLLDPFVDVVRDGRRNIKNTTGGKLLIHLGDISEDVIPDSRFNFENGIRKDGATNFSSPVQTPWGFAPRTQFITDAFDNSESIRAKQDVGLDGLSNQEENAFPHIKTYLEKISGIISNQEVLQKIKDDPSRDDYSFFLDQKFNAPNTTFLQRYQNYLGMENNAPPINDSKDVTNQASTNLADKEDVNQDNTINEIEDYYEYEVDLKPGQLEVGKNNIVDKVSNGLATWYQFRIPIRKPTRSFPAGKEGFKSIRFIRMVTTDWEQPVVLRFAAFQLVSNQYRVYENSLTDKGQIEIKESDKTVAFDVSSVNVEENGCPLEGDCNIKPGTTPYVVPPGFIRDRDFSNNQILALQNEQSLRLATKNLKGGQARAIFKNTQLDLNMYKRIKLFVHTENQNNEEGFAGAFIRIGTDMKNHYYEIEIPKLKNTVNGASDPSTIWPEENEIDIPLSLLREIKLERNKNKASFSDVYGENIIREVDGTISGLDFGNEKPISRKFKIKVKGNPDLSNILVMMLGVKNTDTLNKNLGRDFTAWFDEFRAYGFDQETGEAGILSADIKLADLATVSVSGNFRNYGYGGVQDRISSRSRETAKNFGIASTIELDKFFPLKWGLSIPLFVNYDQSNISPTFNPLDPDIRLSDALLNKSIYQENLTSSLVEDNTVTKGFNFTNVRKIKTNAAAKNHFYDIENFTFSYAQNTTERSSFLLDRYLQAQNRGGFSYAYQPKAKFWMPFSKTKGMTKPFMKNVKDLNFGFMPTTLGFRSDYDRSYILNQFRNAQLNTEGISPNVIKYFLGNRYYDAQWNLTKTIDVIYSAQMTSIQDDIDSISNKEVSFLKGVSSLGRAKNYTQKIQATYQLPLEKFFLTDWIIADARFNNNYGFTAGSFQIKDENADEFGNMLENGRELALNGKVDLVKLYNKVRFLRLANTPAAPKKRFVRAHGDEDEIKLPPSSNFKNLTRILMTVRGINFNISLLETTLLPGFIPSPKYFGLDPRNALAPGIGFVMGSQNRNIHKISAQEGWLSKSIIQNNPFTQTRGVKFDFSTNLEPFKGFRMQIKGNLNRGDSYQEMYRPESVGGGFSTLNPVRNGNFSMSFWSFKTGFSKMSNDSNTLYKYKIFDNMVANRQPVLDRLTDLNKNAEGVSLGTYDLNSQDVLIPAFFSAYSGQSLEKIFEKSRKRGSQTFNPFLAFPMPNWRIDYQGLEKLPVFKKFFNSITVSHSYTSTYSVGNFTSSLEYSSQVLNLLIRDYPLGNKTLDQLTKTPFLGQTPLYVPTFIMSTINMEERFNPVIGVQFTTKKSFTGSFNWNKERKASLNLSNAQVAEYNANDFVFGMGIRKNNIKLPFRTRDGNKIVLKNDLNLRVDVTSRDLKVLQRRLDGDVVPIQGNYNLQIRPQIQYQINQKINISTYFERLVNTPFTSLSYERSSSIFGVTARFNLGD